MVEELRAAPLHKPSLGVYEKPVIERVSYIGKRNYKALCGDCTTGGGDGSGGCGRCSS